MNAKNLGESGHYSIIYQAGRAGGVTRVTPASDDASYNASVLS